MALRDNCNLHSVLGIPGEITTPLIGPGGSEVGSPTYDSGQIVIDAADEGAYWPNTGGVLMATEGRIDIAFRPGGWTITDGRASLAPTGQANTPCCFFDEPVDTNNYFQTFFAANANDFYWIFREGGVYSSPYYDIAPPLMDSADGEHHVMSLIWNEAGIGGGSNRREIYWDGALCWSTPNALTTVPGIGDTSFRFYVGEDPNTSNHSLDGKANWIKVFDADDNDMTGVMSELFGTSKVWPFTTPGNYTYDSGKIQVGSGVTDLKVTAPSSVTFYARWNKDKDAAFSRDGGSKTATLYVDAAWAAGGGKWDGRMNLDGAGNDSACRFNASNNFDHDQIFSASYQFRPNYSGNPAQHSRMVAWRHDPNTNSSFDFYHGTNGNLLVFAREDDGSVLLDSNVEVAWNPTSGTHYHYRICTDFTGGATRFFRNGTSLHAVYTATGSCDRSAGSYRWDIGGYSSFSPNFSMDEVRVDDVVLNTGNFTAPSSQMDIYDAGNPTIKTDESVAASAYDAFVSTEAPDGAAIRYTIEVDGQQKYWSGAAWVNSNGTYAQANPATTIGANIATLTAGTTKIVAFLPSDGVQKPSIDEIELSYTPSALTHRKQMTPNVDYW